MRLDKQLILMAAYLCGCATKNAKTVNPVLAQGTCSPRYYIESVIRYEDYERIKFKQDDAILSSLRKKYVGTGQDVKEGKATGIKISIFEGFHERSQTTGECHAGGGTVFLEIFYCKSPMNNSIRLEIERFGDKNLTAPNEKSTVNIEYITTTWFWNIFWDSWVSLFTNPVDSEVVQTVEKDLNQCK